jgi:hypothetical protein
MISCISISYSFVFDISCIFIIFIRANLEKGIFLYLFHEKISRGKISQNARSGTFEIGIDRKHERRVHVFLFSTPKEYKQTRNHNVAGNVK